MWGPTKTIDYKECVGPTPNVSCSSCSFNDFEAFTPNMLHRDSACYCVFQNTLINALILTQQMNKCDSTTYWTADRYCLILRCMYSTKITIFYTFVTVRFYNYFKANACNSLNTRTPCNIGQSRTCLWGAWWQAARYSRGIRSGR